MKEHAHTHCFLADTQLTISSLMQLRIPCLGNGTASCGLHLPKSINLIHITFYKYAHLTGQPNLDSPSLRHCPGDSELCRVDN